MDDYAIRQRIAPPGFRLRKFLNFVAALPNLSQHPPLTLKLPDFTKTL
jgi:hypothetical protein